MLKKNVFVIFSLALVLTLSLFLGLSLISFASEQPSLPRVELPLLVTTCGQSPGALMVLVLCKQIKLPCDRVDLLKAVNLKSKAEEGNPYKTLIIISGTSRKGMGAAGTNIDNELLRIRAVIEEAKRQGIVIIGAHIEGMTRRVDATDAASINLVIPESNLLLIREDGNEDGYFTKAAEELDIPIITFKENLDLTDVFKDLFSIEE